MLEQERLIGRVTEICAADGRLDAALTYGSFAAGEGDAHSDIEFWLFFAPRWAGRVDARAWCAQVAPVLHLVRNEFGSDVAVFPGLVRGEFHFATTDDIPSVRTWPARGAPVDRMVVLDRSGLLRPALEAVPDLPERPDAATVCGRFANWLLLAHHLAARGEDLRAWDALGHSHRHLLWMARLEHGSTRHWLTPSRGLETDLPADVVAELRGTAAAASDVRTTLGTQWRLGRRSWTALADPPRELFAALDALLL